MALGCPVVATDCDAGPMEILTRKMGACSTEVTFAEYGILVPVNSAKSLADALRIAIREDIRGPVLTTRQAARAGLWGT